MQSFLHQPDSLLTKPTLWFAIQTRPRHEKKVAMQLEEKGISVFLPLRTVLRQWSDRQVGVTTALFPGYLFVEIGADRRARGIILRTAGIVGFVGMRGVGVPVPEDQILAIKEVLSSRIPFTIHPFLAIGQKVRVCGGSLDGVEGILKALNGDRSVVISIESIQRSLAVRIEGYQVEAA